MPLPDERQAASASACTAAQRFMLSLIVREENMRAIDEPTVRVDQDAGHALRGYSAARTSAEAAAECTVPL